MSVPQRFGVLRLVGTMLKVLAWSCLVGSILLALALGLAGPILRQSLGDVGLQPELLAMGTAGGLVVGVLLMVVGVVTFLSLFATGEKIFLQLAIEENTRMTAALLLQEAEKRDGMSATPGISAAQRTYYGEVVG